MKVRLPGSPVPEFSSLVGMRTVCFDERTRPVSNLRSLDRRVPEGCGDVDALSPPFGWLANPTECALCFFLSPPAGSRSERGGEVASRQWLAGCAHRQRRDGG